MSDSMSRSAQRQMRLMEMEKEQYLEDMQALAMTEEQRQILLRSFNSVKVEFLDLDGQRWTHSALRRRSHAPLTEPESPTPARTLNQPPPAFSILTNADLDLGPREETIRAPRPRIPSHRALHMRSRARSPAKGLFPLTATNRHSTDAFQAAYRIADSGEEDTDPCRGRVGRPVGPRLSSPVRQTSATIYPHIHLPPMPVTPSPMSSFSADTLRTPVPTSNGRSLDTILHGRLTEDDWSEFDDGLKTPVIPNRREMCSL